MNETKVTNSILVALLTMSVIMFVWTVVCFKTSTSTIKPPSVVAAFHA